MVRLKTVKRSGGYFWVSRQEVWQVMSRANIETVTEAMKILFPRLRWYRIGGRGGYWGMEGRR